MPMRFSVRLLLLAAFLLCLAPAASAVTLDWVSVGDPGNACDTQAQGCFGAVAYGYQISETEVTNAQYTEFLNAKAVSDPLSLHTSGMSITRSGSSGSYSYNAVAGRENMPVVSVSFYNTLRFANWLNNGQGSGDTETGAYTLLGGTATPSNGLTVTRNAGANIFLSSEDEWYKAAYYDATSMLFLDYPAGTDTPTSCSGPTATANSANCGGSVADVTPVGSYTGSESPYGTFDQGGNVWEWNEAIIGSNRSLRSGAFNIPDSNIAASTRLDLAPTSELGNVGFRVASLIPEPSAGLLVTVGLLCLAGWRRNHA